MLKALFSSIVGPMLAPMLVGVPLQGNDDQAAHAAAQMVTSIFEYSRWPQPTDPIRLCVIGPAEHGEAMTRFTLSDGRKVVRTSLPASGAYEAGSCDAFYLGRMPLDQLRRWTAAARAGAVVTVAEADPECRSEAMFCFLFEPHSLSFRLNIDAVARSKVRIDPRVLRLARGSAPR